MNKIAISFLACAAITFTGCGKKGIDTTSDESTKASIAAATKSMTPEQKREFDEAVVVIAMDGVNLFSGAGVEGAKDKMKDSLSGKSPDQVIAEAKAIKARRAADLASTIQKQIDEIKAAEAASIDAAEKMKSFVAIDPKFAYVKQRFGGDDPTATMTVRNGFNKAVSSVTFRAVLSSPGRSIPWVDDTFSYEFAGGLEPGEQKDLELDMNGYSDWGKPPKDRKDYVLTLEVVKLTGPNDAVLLEATFGKHQKEQLAELQKLLEQTQK